MKQKRGYKRGYPVALLVGLEYDHAILWQVFSNVVKLHRELKLTGKRTDKKEVYNFHESVFNALRPMLTEGVRSVIVVAPMKTTYAQDFLDHMQKHHAYTNQAKKSSRTTFAKLVGSADQPYKVDELVRTSEFRKLITETTSEEADHIVSILEKQLFGNIDNSTALYSLKEIEDRIYNRDKVAHSQAEYLVLTDRYLTDSNAKNRINKLLQTSKNKQVTTRIVNAQTTAGKRISQFGGIVFFTIPTRYTLIEEGSST